jgi:hypothetical protein
MEPVKVPQHLDLEDVLIWGLGGIDLLLLVAGGLVAWWLYLALPIPFGARLAVASLVAGACTLLSLGRAGDRTLRGVLLIVAGYLRRPRRHLYGGGR